MEMEAVGAVTAVKAVEAVEAVKAVAMARRQFRSHRRKKPIEKRAQLFKCRATGRYQPAVGIL
jgi:hypothetical protein